MENLTRWKDISIDHTQLNRNSLNLVKCQWSLLPKIKIRALGWWKNLRTRPKNLSTIVDTPQNKYLFPMTMSQLLLRLKCQNLLSITILTHTMSSQIWLSQRAALMMSQLVLLGEAKRSSDFKMIFPTTLPQMMRLSKNKAKKWNVS